MKKIYISCLVIIVLCFLITSCDFSGTEGKIMQNTESELSGEVSDRENPEVLFEMSLLKNDTENYDIFRSSQTLDFSAKTFQDKSAKPTLEIRILGEDYELEYIESAHLPLNAYPVHKYKIKGTEYSEILISAETDKVVKYSNIPIKVLYTTEHEYKAFIQEIVGDEYALSDYQYKCTTWRYIFTDDSMSSNVTDGFYVCGNNEKLGSYSFYFEKEIGGLKTLEHISAEFDEDSFSLEMYDFNYESSTFDRILRTMDAWQEKMQNYLRAEVSNEFTVGNIEAISHTLFIRNGIPYVKSHINVEYSRTDENDTYIQRVETVTCINSKS